MTPQEVVSAADAELESVAVMPGDPDVRLSMWHAKCQWCPRTPDGRGGLLGRPTFTGMALTTDGYETATYARHPFSGIVTAVLNPRDDLFLVVDSGNGREWLLGLDGKVRRVERVSNEIRPTDPRLWFECGRAGGWVTTWCSLDPDAGTAYVWPEEWDRSVASPSSDQQPWGSTPYGGTWEHPGALVEAWWYDGGQRQTHQLGTDVRGDGIIGTPEGELAYWVWRPGDDSVELHTSQDRGATWDVGTREAPGFNRWVQMTRSPDGALLAWSYWPHLVVWRAEASGGGFRRVHEVVGPEMAGSDLRTEDDVVYVSGSGTAAVSSDGGLTWSIVDTWR